VVLALLRPPASPQSGASSFDHPATGAGVEPARWPASAVPRACCRGRRTETLQV